MLVGSSRCTPNGQNKIVFWNAGETPRQELGRLFLDFPLRAERSELGLSAVLRSGVTGQQRHRSE